MWALVVMALPFVGPLAYLVVGRAMGDPLDDGVEADEEPAGYTPSRW